MSNELERRKIQIAEILCGLKTVNDIRRENGMPIHFGWDTFGDTPFPVWVESQRKNEQHI